MVLLLLFSFTPRHSNGSLLFVFDDPRLAHVHAGFSDGHHLQEIVKTLKTNSSLRTRVENSKRVSTLASPAEEET